MTTKLLNILFLLVTVLISSCIPNLREDTFITTTAVVKADVHTPMSTSTNTLVPTATPNPTTTPMILLPTYEPQIFFHHLAHDDTICKLPCWGTIIPGETTFDASVQYLKPIIESLVFEYESSQLHPHYNGFRLTDDKNEVFVDAFFHYGEDGVIQTIETYRIGYSMQKLIESYGKPAEFYFLSDYLLDDEYVTDVFFYYPTQHFMAVFRQIDSSIDKEISFCSSRIENNSPYLVMWSGQKDFISLVTLFYRESGRQNLIREVNEYAETEAIKTFFDSATEEEVCLKLKYPWE